MAPTRRLSRWLALACVTLGFCVALAWLSWGPQPALARTVAGAPPTITAASGGHLQEQAPARRTIEVTARRYSFSPSRIEVQENDLVKIVFQTEDIPHSFTIDEYRIAKRAVPGQAVVFEFLAEQVGTFAFYCSLTAEEGCRKMRGELVVRSR